MGQPEPLVFLEVFASELWLVYKPYLAQKTLPETSNLSTRSDRLGSQIVGDDVDSNEAITRSYNQLWGMMETDVDAQNISYKVRGGGGGFQENITIHNCLLSIQHTHNDRKREYNNPDRYRWSGRLWIIK